MLRLERHLRWRNPHGGWDLVGAHVGRQIYSTRFDAVSTPFFLLLFSAPKWNLFVLSFFFSFCRDVTGWPLDRSKRRKFFVLREPRSTRIRTLWPSDIFTTGDGVEDGREFLFLSLHANLNMPAFSPQPNRLSTSQSCCWRTLFFILRGGDREIWWEAPTDIGPASFWPSRHNSEFIAVPRKDSDLQRAPLLTPRRQSVMAQAYKQQNRPDAEWIAWISFSKVCLLQRDIYGTLKNVECDKSDRGGHQ